MSDHKHQVGRDGSANMDFTKSNKNAELNNLKLNKI